MDRDLSDRIRERAYEIWITAGRRDGEAEQHWLAAERELLAASSLPETTKATKARRAPRRPKRVN
jgi:hypothetical protein